MMMYVLFGIVVAFVIIVAFVAWHLGKKTGKTVTKTKEVIYVPVRGWRRGGRPWPRRHHRRRWRRAGGARVGRVNP